MEKRKSKKNESDDEEEPVTGKNGYHKQSSSSSSEEDDSNSDKGKTATKTYTEIILERDYTLGILTRFSTIFPAQLKNRVTEEEFAHTIETINDIFYDSENVSLVNCVESFVACISFYTYYLCIPPRYTKNLSKLEAFLESENENIYHKQGLTWVNPLHNGLLYILILDETGSKDD